MVLTSGHDAVVIGSGAGGAAAAWRLCERGLRVLLLEAGPAFDPARDYPLDRPGWERRGFPEPAHSRAAISYGDLGRLEPEDEDIAGWSRAGFPWRLPVGSARPPSATGYSHVQGVGGSTLHFVGEAHRFHPRAFRLFTLTGQGADWPLDYAALEPFYTIAEEVIGVAGDAGADAGGRWRSRAFPQPPHPASPGAVLLAGAGRDVGQHWQVNPRAVLSRAEGDRPACNYCGQCARGCPLGDKGSADVTFLRRARATGRLTLVPLASVVRLVAGPAGRIVRAEVIVGGRREQVEAPVFVLSAGAVQTPRLLLLSADADHPAGLANSSGAVGRNFMETLSWLGEGLVDSGLRNSHMGLPADAVCWDRAAPGRVEGLAGGFRLGHATLEAGLNGPIAYAARLVPGFGAGFKAALRARFGTALAVSAVGQVIADERSRVTLDSEVRDSHGLPAARIDSVLTGESRALLRRMAEAGRAALRAAGAVIGAESSSRDAFTATHVFGTARMGTDAATSVVDAHGRAHDHANLWIADASVFPTSGAGEAPALTVMALAIRTADAIVA